MHFKDFSLSTRPYIYNAYCKCGEDLREVSNGFFNRVLFCSKCHSVYALELVKLPKKTVSKHFIDQCMKEVAKQKI